MKQISTSAELKAAIADLEKKREIQQLTIKGQLAQTKEALNPVKLVKNTFSHVAEIPEVRKTLVSTIIGIGIGYLSNKVSALLNDEEKLDRMVNNFVDQGIERVQQQKPNGFLSQALSLTRQVARDTK
jgi:CRISPR/Cas system CSM-associated protein Csm5 (group 7 of RAMP superfamily)